MTFCECYDPTTGLIERWKQLFRIGWYPATMERLSTPFTFALLDFFHELTHQGKANLYDFHKTLDRITNNSGTVAGSRGPHRISARQDAEGVGGSRRLRQFF